MRRGTGGFRHSPSRRLWMLVIPVLIKGFLYPLREVRLQLRHRIAITTYSRTRVREQLQHLALNTGRSHLIQQRLESKHDGALE